jgi:deoxyribodipyrimidine photolyase-like uncharacterized protein
MRLAMIRDGVVYNMSAPPEDYVVQENEVLLPDDSPVGIGWKYDGDDFWPPEPEQIEPPPPIVNPVPQTVSQRNARLALLAIGRLGEVDSIINSLPEPQKSAARIEWEYANEFHRSNALLNQLAAALSLDSEHLDQLFVSANAIPD